jgi:hypothetical protein
MRALLALVLVACAAPRPFVPARVYVVEPCWVHHGAFGPYRDVEIQDGNRQPLLQFGNVPSGREDCESRDYMPLVSCGGSTVMRYDGCRWACRPLFELVEQPPSHLTIDFQGYRAEGQ